MALGERMGYCLEDVRAGRAEKPGVCSRGCPGGDLG